MSAVRPVLVPPSATRPPPGRADETLSLLAHAAAPLQSDHIRVLLRVLGTGGTPPATPDRAPAEAGGPPVTAGGLVIRAKEIARRAGPPASLLAADRLLADQIRSGADAALALYGAGLTAGVLHPDTVLLAMDWFGCV